MGCTTCFLFIASALEIPFVYMGFFTVFYRKKRSLTAEEQFNKLERDILELAEHPWGEEPRAPDPVQHTPFTGREDWFAVAACSITAIILVLVALQ